MSLQHAEPSIGPSYASSSGMAFTFRSSGFADGEAIPRRFTCDDDNLAPPLAWSDPPQGTRSARARHEARTSKSRARDVISLMRWSQ